MSLFFMALVLLATTPEASAPSTSDAAPNTAKSPAPETPAEPRIVCKNIEVTGSRLAKKKKVCLPEGEWSESARRNMGRSSR